MANCNKQIIKLRQGDDSDFNDNHIIFHLVTNLDLRGWKAKFKLQNITWVFDCIHDKTIDLVISREQTNSLEVGTYYGWLQLIDSNNKQGTIYNQQFQILKREVY